MPFNPAVTNQSGQILAAGIASAGDSIADGIKGYMAKAKQLKAMRAMAVDGFGMDPDEVDKADLPTLQGKLQGLSRQSDQKFMALQTENETLKNMMMRSQIAAGQRSQENDRVFNGAVADASAPPAMQDMNRWMQGAPGMRGPMPTGMPAAPGMMVDPNAATQDPPVDFNRLMRISAASGTLTPQSALQFSEKMDAVRTRSMGRPNGKGLPVGQQITNPDGSVITGMGEQNEPHFDKVTPPPKGMKLGDRFVNESGDVYLGMGDGSEPKVFPAEDVKNKKEAGDTGRGRSVFKQAAPEFFRQLDNLEKTVVSNNGNTAATTWKPDDVAALGQLPFQIAENYNKIVDPHSVNRPDKLEQDMKHLLPMGATTRKDVTLSAIRSLRAEGINRVRNFYASEKDIPPNLPESVKAMLNIPGMSTASDDPLLEQARAAISAGKDPAAVKARYESLSNKKWSD